MGLTASTILIKGRHQSACAVCVHTGIIYSFFTKKKILTSLTFKAILTGFAIYISELRHPKLYLTYIYLIG